MIEALESRQLFSVTFMTATSATEAPTGVVVEADATVEKKPSKPQPTEKPTYMVYTMETVVVAS
jgi:hypothetical protein